MVCLCKDLKIPFYNTSQVLSTSGVHLKDYIFKSLFQELLLISQMSGRIEKKVPLCPKLKEYLSKSTMI